LFSGRSTTRPRSRGEPLQGELVIQNRHNTVVDVREGLFFKIESEPCYFSNRRRNIEGVSMANGVCLARAKSA